MATISQGKVPLLPRQGIYLTVRRGDGSRFASLFRTTWDRLPLAARRTLLLHWRLCIQSYPDAPRIQLVSRIPGAPRTVLAAASDEGCLYEFRFSLVTEMPDDVVQDLIAHEPAHGIEAARGIRPVGRDSYQGPNGHCFGRDEFEEDADNWTRFWGFDPDSIDRWWTGRGDRTERRCP
jgi:hypothetical protein